ncbi:restriction endonuclease subunit S [Aeromonas veronii]|uniref:restriction endonuclease subunit S n=1 Tax=Aeromonas veronii TaxID=654 RepID=UPI0009BECB53|nr:restriction endonuclease subunit S [Aeromonas veronii]
MSDYKKIINSIPKDWEVKSISELGIVIGGGTPTRDISTYWNGNISWITPGEVSKLNNKFVVNSVDKITEQGLYASGANLLPEGSLLVTSRATLGARAICSKPMATNQGFKSIVFNKRSDASFYYHFFGLLKTEMARRASGTTFLEISSKEFSSIPLPYPPDNERTKIAHILDTVDTEIQQTELLIEKLQLVKQGLLNDLLTRGIGVDGQLRPTFQQEPSLYKKSPLGWIPKDWVVSMVSKEFDVNSGITLGPHRSPNRNPQKYLRVANIHRDQLILNDISELEASETEVINKSIELHDLLVVEGHASTDEIGRCAIADETVVGMLFQNHLFRLRAKKINPFFGLLWMNSSFAKHYWRCEAATSSGLNTINRTKLNEMHVAVPQPYEQNEIVKVASDSKLRLQQERCLLSKLQDKKSAIMNDLLTGRVRVEKPLNHNPMAQ